MWWFQKQDDRELIDLQPEGTCAVPWLSVALAGAGFGYLLKVFLEMLYY